MSYYKTNHRQLHKLRCWQKKIRIRQQNILKENRKEEEKKILEYKKDFEIILVSTGCFQEYIIDNINQLLTLGCKNIHVITEKRYFRHIEQFDIVKKIDTSELSCDFDLKSKLDKRFRNGFWNNCSKRLFLLYEYMKKYDIKDVIHLENDVLLYTKLHYLFENKVYLTADNL